MSSLTNWIEKGLNSSTSRSTGTTAFVFDFSSPYDDVLLVIQTVINCFIIHIVDILGAFGNSITLIVLYRNGIRDTSNMLLLSLAACDLIFLVSLSVDKLSAIISQFNSDLFQLYRTYIIVYLWVPTRLFASISGSHIIVISIERYLAVCYPFKVSRWVTRRRMMLALAIVYVSCLLLSFPNMFLCLEIAWVFDSGQNKTFPKVQLTEFYEVNEEILDIFTEIISPLILGSLSFAVVIFCSCAIIFKLQALSKKRSTMTAKPTDVNIDLKVSRLLLTVCITYIVTGLPSFVAHIFLYGKQISPYSILYSFIYDVNVLFTAINSAANFVIYILLSNKFSKSVKSLFGCLTDHSQK